MSHWKSELESYLVTGSRYCFKTDPQGNYPTLDEVEFYGTESDVGFLDRIISLVYDLRKKAFYSGFVEGAKAACQDLGKGEVFDPEVSQFGASRSWELLEKDLDV